MHNALPQKMTPENLGAWIAENAIDKKDHVEKFDLTKDEIVELEHASSLASRAIDRLESIHESFKYDLKNGVVDPATFTIPPTKGLKELMANREFADAQIEKGYKEIHTDIYGIPYPETRKIVYFDIEGNHFEEYDKKMTPEQLKNFGKPMLEEGEEADPLFS